MKKYILAITGASGAIFGIRLIEELLKSSEVHLIISSNAFSIIKDETGIDFKCGSAEVHKCGMVEDVIREYFKRDNIYLYEEWDMSAPVASGSFKTNGMLVVPCSMKTLSGIANGYANNLIERAADVIIKEGRLLLLCPREMPFSAIHLENMLKLAKLGIKIAPPIPAFYHKPKNLDDIVDFIVGKILDTFCIEHELFKRWGS